MTLGARFPLVLSAAVDGAEWAWEELYRDLAPGLLRFLAAHGASDPDDVLGEVFIQIVRRLGTFSGEEPNFRTWAFTIARSRLIDAWRREQRRPARANEDVVDVAEQSLLESTESPAERREAVAAILAGLSVHQRDILLLRYVHEFSIEETAQIVGKTQGAVRVLQHRALHRLRRTLRTRSTTASGAPSGGEPHQAHEGDSIPSLA